MKSLYFVLIAFLSNLSITMAQVIDVATSLNRPQLMEVKDDYLYVAESQSGVISRIDITDSTYTSVDLITGLNNPVGLKILDDELYVTELYGNRIFKVDLTDPNLTQVDILTNIDRPSGIEIIGSELFFTVASMSNDKLMKVNLNDPNKIVTQVIGGLQDPVDIAARGNELYISEFLGNKVVKIDVVSPNFGKVDVVTGGLNGPVALHFIGNELYIANYNSNEIVKVNVGQSLPILGTLNVESVASPYGLVFDGNDMYVSDFDTKVVTFNIFPVTTNSLQIAQNWSIFPNPTQEFIQIQDLNLSQTYTIVDMAGRVLQTGVVYPSQKVSIQNLMKGMYFIRLENGEVEKFMKY